MQNTRMFSTSRESGVLFFRLVVSMKLDPFDLRIQQSFT